MRITMVLALLLMVVQANADPLLPPDIYSEGGGKTVTISGKELPRDLAFRFLPVTLPLTSIEISSLYGMRRNPFGGGREFHPGVDFRAPYGETVFCTAAGIVTFAGRDGDYGEVVEVKHALGFKTRYAHLSKIDVQPGQVVDRDTPVGNVGATGRATGPHLYLEIWHDDQRLDPIGFILRAQNLYHRLD